MPSVQAFAGRGGRWLAAAAATVLVVGGSVSAAELVAPQEPRPGWQREWPDTDFSRSTVDFGDILSGGPPKDGIPAVDEPEFGAARADDVLSPLEPVVTVEFQGVTRAYPIRYLIWHEIVNDRIDGVPLAVTYCPLCNSALVFDARLEGRELDFGVSGKLRNSDLIMYDRQTESWWQQFTGEGIVGQYAGVPLTPIPVLLESWESFQERHPDGEVMQQPGLSRPYGRNPYSRYDTSAVPFLYRGEMPPAGIDPLARVVRVGDRAWLLSRLREEGEITEAGVTLRWRSGQVSALDTAEIAEGRDVGNVTVTDASGEPLVHEVTFAFVFQAFVPEGTWM